jgi:hypothetical protein
LPQRQDVSVRHMHVMPAEGLQKPYRRTSFSDDPESPPLKLCPHVGGGGHDGNRGTILPKLRAVGIPPKRQELYEKRHPQTKHGRAPGAKGPGSGGKTKDDNLSSLVASFAEDAAKKTGSS